MRTAALLLVAALAAAPQDDPPGDVQQPTDASDESRYRPGLTEGQTRGMVVRFERARHWALRGFVLLALGERWHPSGAQIVVEALRSHERNLHAYAVECLVLTDPDALRRVASAELVEELIKNHAREKDDAYRARVHQVLTNVFPDAGVTEPAEWSGLWRKREEGYAPEPWIPPPPPKGDGRTTAMGGVERAFDLYEAGLDVVICLDTTGSMQPTIDAARDSIDDLVTLLSGIAPKFRLGLVEYKDRVDFDPGARVLEPLTARPERVKKKLERTSAAGGGDFPEAVATGLEVALDREVDWERSTNKLILVIGDAPPKDTERAIDLARDAREKPFGIDPTDLTKNTRRTRSIVRPFVIAAVGVGADSVPRPTEKAFMRLAQAGGGAYAQLLTRPTSAQGTPEAPSEAIARHVLTLAFGAQWQGQVETFVEVYMRYHRSGFLR